MAKINSHFLKLKAGYLFPEISKRVDEFMKRNPTHKLIKLGIGDVVRPLSPTILKAFHDGVEAMGDQARFKGYGPERGYGFLRDLIVEKEYLARGISISPEEIFISDGSKCDTGNITEIFSADSKVAVSDPVYPVYVDTNVMAGRTGEGGEEGKYAGIYYMPCVEENNFSPALPTEKVDLIYLCFPNNPTGAVLSKNALAQWVEYAKENQAIILFDAAYEAFIQEEAIAHSIYEIPGADEVAIEFRSFSKNAGFTGVRCAYTVVPQKLLVEDEKGKRQSLHALWHRRQSTKFNGVSYPVQRAAAAVYTDAGQREVKDLVTYYMHNAQSMREALSRAGYAVFGGVNAPYVWVKSKDGRGSWEMFDTLLNEAQVVGTPGEGFGPSGKGYLRFSAFGTHEAVDEAMQRIQTLGI